MKKSIVNMKTRDKRRLSLVFQVISVSTVVFNDENIHTLLWVVSYISTECLVKTIEVLITKNDID